MKNTVATFFKNMYYALSSNFIVLALSVIMTLIVPKVIGVTEYSFWQLYMFYVSYVGILHFGWLDGIYLKYGGYDYDKLDRKKFANQFWLLVLFELIISAIICVLTIGFVHNSDKQYVFIMTAICSFVTITKQFFLYILQITNRIKEYAKYTRLDRILYCGIVLLILISGGRGYKGLLVIDILTKVITLILCIKSCKEIVFCKIENIFAGIKETIDDISIGIKLMIANFAGLAIIGVIRLGIEQVWNVETFGKISLTINVSNTLVTFINSIGIIMFPMLKRISKEKLSNIYVVIRNVLMCFLLGMLILYYPLKEILVAWLPKYSESLQYMAMLFPICIFESKMSLLINTYLKTLRKEKQLLQVNLFSALISVVLVGINCFWLKNLNLTILSIVIVLAIRAIIAEIYLEKYLNIKIKKDIIIELILCTIFIISSWYIKGINGVIIYTLFYILYLIFKEKDIKNSINIFKEYSFKQNTTLNK